MSANAFFIRFTFSHIPALLNHAHPLCPRRLSLQYSLLAIMKLDQNLICRKNSETCRRDNYAVRILLGNEKFV